jgi:glycosyltransferase involved in cell wall biosynthesis
VPDGTRDILRALNRELENLTIVDDVWDSESEARNAGLRHLRNLGTQVCLIVDADEIYPVGALDRLRGAIEAVNTPDTVFYARYLTCYKRFDYIVESDHRTPVAIHITDETAFHQRPRRPAGARRDLPGDVFFWHMGYVLTDERMWEKINTFGHVREIVPGWFEEKWVNWTPETRDLFRKHPVDRWPRTIRIDPLSLPEILHSHPQFPPQLGPKTTLPRNPR